MSTPATYFYLTIKNSRVVVQYKGTNGGEFTRVISSAEDYNQFFVSKANEAGIDPADLTIQCSSSMDFPEEYTDDPEVIALTDAIRG